MQRRGARCWVSGRRSQVWNLGVGVQDLGFRAAGYPDVDFRSVHGLCLGVSGVGPGIFFYRVGGLGLRVERCRVSGRRPQVNPAFRVSNFGFRISGLGFRFSGFKFRFSGFGFRVSGFGYQVYTPGYPDVDRRSLQRFGFRFSGFGFRVLDFKFRVSGIGGAHPGVLKSIPGQCCVSGFGFSDVDVLTLIPGLGFEVWGVGFGVWDLGCRVWSAGFRADVDPRSLHGACFRVLGDTRWVQSPWNISG